VLGGSGSIHRETETGAGGRELWARRATSRMPFPRRRFELDLVHGSWGARARAEPDRHQALEKVRTEDGPRTLGASRSRRSRPATADPGHLAGSWAYVRRLQRTAMTSAEPALWRGSGNCGSDIRCADSASPNGIPRERETADVGRDGRAVGDLGLVVSVPSKVHGSDAPQWYHHPRTR
jgi:hypothetical protein